ncbi:hypothetical protein [Oleiagrimonas sp. MCCC 1A03011]|uniref:hypothetical protein n=1 Tax=Oleiagrimonas sp. MCCC 1A03011 TaxID=1926883 RepID=UPI000DC2626D|nr:hypothetical protein [Oleiagrimonas sp. MCCC 1A03011]RAP58552.1 hypothetical protein BTJ49_06390 [Oleiagrimonas sp. MCCC 1A03011]
MKGKRFAIGGALLVATLAACSHKPSDTPLSYVPNDTPYLLANIQPMDADMRAAIYKQADQQLPMQVAQMHQTAAKLKEKDPKVAALLDVFADEFDGRTMEQSIRHMGLDPDGRSAFYGLGLSPVMRVQLSDPAAFQAFVGRIEKALGTSLSKATLDNVTYQYADFGKNAKLRFLTAERNKQAVLALLPANADEAMMRLALGLKHPARSIEDSGKLKKLIDAEGYQPYAASYVDFRQLPALIAGEKDPMLKALLASSPDAATKLPASCKADFDRMAARMPMISFGLTKLKPEHIGYRVNVALAPDIAKTFASIDVGLPGLSGNAPAPLDLAIALPVKEFRAFWMAQADAVSAKPFTCPALTKLNDGFAKLRMAVQKTAVPPVNDLRGLRVMIDRFDMPTSDSDSKMPKIAGRLLIASDNPEGMLAMAQMAAPPLSQMKLEKDGKPVALPADLTQKAGGEPAWVAMTDHLLAIAVGTGEDQHLTRDMKASGKAAGALAAFRLNGDMYRKWVNAMTDKVIGPMQHAAAQNKDPNAAKQAQEMAQRMQQLKEQAEHIDNIAEKFHADDKGITVDVDVQRH